MEEQNNQSQNTTPAPQQSPLSGLQPNVAAALCYSLGFILGVFFYMMSQDKTVKFHALQSTFTFLGILVIDIALGLVPGLGLVLTPLVALASIALWIFLMVKAYNGEKFKLPIIGDLAEQNVK